MTEVEFIQEYKTKKLPEIALLLSKLPHLNKDFILNQINGIQKAKNKLPKLANVKGIIFPSKLSLEQSSSEETATYKANQLRHYAPDAESIVDLTGGFGIDSYYFSKQFDNIAYVEPNAELLEMVKQNFNTLGVSNIKAIHQTAEDFLKSNSDNFDIAYIDPSRRNENQRVFQLEDCVPNIIELAPKIFESARKILVKTAPLLDIKQSIRDLEFVTHVFVVSVNNECKEVLYLLENDIKKEPQIHAINLGKVIHKFTFDYELEAEAQIAYSEPLQYLYEPNTSILKGGAFNCIAKQYELNKIAPNTHLYTSNNLAENFPGRIFNIEKVLPYQPKAFKKLGIKQANVSCRNFKDSVEQVKKKLNLKDGGETYVIGTTDKSEKPLLIICQKT